MKHEEIQKKLSEAVRASISLVEVGRNTFQIESPFEFEDGDRIVAFIEIIEDNVYFTDRGHTLMHVSYDVDVSTPTRQKVIENVILNNELEIKDGIIFTVSSLSDIKQAFWDFVQGIIRISDVSQWKFERAVSLFFEEFDIFMETRIQPKVPIVKKDWFEPKIDSKELYLIPWACMNERKPLFVFPINSDNSCSQAVISCLKYKESNFEFESLAIFQDIDAIQRKIRNQCLDTVVKPYTNFSLPIQDDAEKYILTHV